MNAVDLFRSALHTAGLDYAGPIIADGKLHRFKSGEDHESNSWYVLHEGSPCAGAFGCWKRQIKETWCERNPSSMPPAERQRLREQWRRADEQRKQDEVERHAEARAKAEEIHAQAASASPTHAYLVAKGVKSHGDMRERDGEIVLPLRDACGVLHSLQSIDASGGKWFLPGGKVAGGFYTIPGPDTGPLIICEGYATGATIHEATGHAVVCAMNCGNLLSVAQALRNQWPTREIIIAGDNDQFTDGNPGLSKATEAANTIAAKQAIPQFTDLTANPTDFNDLFIHQGIDTVKAQIEKAEAPTETDQQAFERLGKLSSAAYDRIREAEAKRLGIRIGTLDSEVERHRTKTEAADQTIEPWSGPVNGAELLEEIATTFRRFCALPPHASIVLAVWVLQTYCYRLFDFVGVIAVWSPEPECGKGRVLDVTDALSWHPFRTSNTSAAVLYHSVAKGDITVLIDELDSQSDEQRTAISNILKSGFQSNGKAHRMTERSGQQEVVEFPTFSPKMIATIGLENLDKATRTRSISVRMSRKRRDAKIEKFRRFDGTEFRRKCLRWVQDNIASLQAVGPLELDECATDRQEDVWEPLVAIARVAGGEWETRIREAARNLSGAAGKAACESAGHQLLTAIRDYFAIKDVSKVGTKTLIDHLNEGGNFSDQNRGRGLTPTYLAKLLRPYNISSRDLKMPEGNVLKGYDRGDFDEAFDVYLAGSEVSKRNSATKAENIDQNTAFENATETSCSVSGNTTPTNNDGAGSAVAFPKLQILQENTNAPELREEELASADLL